MTSVWSFTSTLIYLAEKLGVLTEAMRIVIGRNPP
jgi:hypothetical protein